MAIYKVLQIAAFRDTLLRLIKVSLQVSYGMLSCKAVLLLAILSYLVEVPSFCGHGLNFPAIVDMWRVCKVLS